MAEPDLSDLDPNHENYLPDVFNRFARSNAAPLMRTAVEMAMEKDPGVMKTVLDQTIGKAKARSDADQAPKVMELIVVTEDGSEPFPEPPPDQELLESTERTD